MNHEEGHKVVRCSSHEALHRAKSLVNIQFSWLIIGVTIFAVSFYLVLVNIYGDNKVEYFSLGNEEEEELHGDVESQKRNMVDNDNFNNFIHAGKILPSTDMER